MSSCLRMNISAGSENPFIKKPWRGGTSALKRQYSLSCSTVTLESDILISPHFVLSSFLAE